MIRRLFLQALGLAPLTLGGESNEQEDSWNCIEIGAWCMDRKTGQQGEIVFIDRASQTIKLNNGEGIEPATDEIPMYRIAIRGPGMTKSAILRWAERWNQSKFYAAWPQVRT